MSRFIHLRRFFQSSHKLPMRKRRGSKLGSFEDFMRNTNCSHKNLDKTMIDRIVAPLKSKVETSKIAYMTAPLLSAMCTVSITAAECEWKSEKQEQEFLSLKDSYLQCPAYRNGMRFQKNSFRYHFQMCRKRNLFSPCSGNRKSSTRILIHTYTYL